MKPGYNACPICNQPKKIESLRCRKCRIKEESAPVTCPSCGGKKLSTAEVCPDCVMSQKLSQVSYNHIPTDWAYAFWGLFMGEGSVGIYLDRRMRGAYQARCAIKLRADDRPLLVNTQSMLGGSLYEESRQGKNPQVSWASTDFATVYAVCCLLSQHAIMPAKKMRDVEIVREFCLWRSSQRRPVDWSVAAEMRNWLLKCKVFSSSE